MKTLIGSDEVSSLEVPILELSGWPTCSAIPSCQRLSLLLSAVQPRSELEEFYRRFFHLVCLNLPIMFKCLRLYVSTSYFKTDIVLFPATSTLVIWLWRIFQKSYQQVFACETPTICQRGQVSRFFNWPIIVCVLLKCLFLSVAMDCNLVPMDCNLVPMDCDLVPMDLPVGPCFLLQSHPHPMLIAFYSSLCVVSSFSHPQLCPLNCKHMSWMVGLRIICDVFAIYWIDKQLFQNAMT